MPEYTCGAQSFPDFLALMSTDSELISNKDKQYYQACANVTLDRQVGSRYFVSAANASKILFLKDAAIEYLKFTGKNDGNKLERAVYLKLQDEVELNLLRADSLMYYHIYADLVMLSKSNDLGKTAFDMNQHYLELKKFLQEVQSHPEATLSDKYRVFSSEKRLYESNKKVNHRLKSPQVYKNLFEVQESEITALFPVLVAGARAMEMKLSAYAKDQLPDGKYWDPEPSVRGILTQLKPTNDVCESVLGLNDYLTTAVPNLHQTARSNLVQIKKNKTLKWLSSLPEKEQASILDLAVHERQRVFKECKEEEQQQALQRRQGMLQANIRRRALRQKALEEVELLTQQHLITSSQELYDAITEIENNSSSASKKKVYENFLA